MLVFPPAVQTSYTSFAARPVSLLGFPLDLPEINAPVPSVLQARSQWCTTYLDADTRVGRWSNGNIFLFKRSSD